MCLFRHPCVGFQELADTRYLWGCTCPNICTCVHVPLDKSRMSEPVIFRIPTYDGVGSSMQKLCVYVQSPIILKKYVQSPSPLLDCALFKFWSRADDYDVWVDMISIVISRGRYFKYTIVSLVGNLKREQKQSKVILFLDIFVWREMRWKQTQMDQLIPV